MLLPYQVTMCDNTDNKLYTETIVALNESDARTRILNMRVDTEILEIRKVKILRYNIVELDTQCGVESIIYTSNDPIQTQIILDHLQKVWTGTHYSFRIAQ